MPLFTKETAKQMAARSVAVRFPTLNAEQVEIEAEIVTNEIPAVLPLDEQCDTASDDYKRKRLLRVRKQLDRLDTWVQDEMTQKDKDGQRIKPNGQLLNWFASAQERLAEQERLLSNRPLPGSHRPRSDSKKRRGGAE